MWGDYHLRELALYIGRVADDKCYLAFFAPAAGGRRLSRDSENSDRPQVDVTGETHEAAKAPAAPGERTPTLAARRAGRTE
jgi:hypothetical protein